MKNQNTTKIANSGYASFIGITSVIGICVISGVIYIVIQWYTLNKIEDAFFVSLLIAATMILMLGLRQLQKYIVTKSFDFYSFVLTTADPNKTLNEHTKLCESVINVKRMTISGVLYGLFIGLAPFILGAWEDNIVLKSFLSIFMFTVNFATGVAFYGLITFFYHAIKMGSLVKVNLWNVENPSTTFLLGATRRLAILASIYVSICLSSILFSVLPLSSLILMYCCFSACIILASIVLPTLPVAYKLKEAKEETLLQIDQQVQTAFSNTIKSLNDDESSENLDSFESLLQLREKDKKVSMWPFKLKAITAGLSVIFFSSIPVILQFTLEYLFNQ